MSRNCILTIFRQSKKEAAKEAKREEEMKHITSTITDLYFTVQKQQTQLREMERLIHSIGMLLVNKTNSVAPVNFFGTIYII